MSSLSAWLSSAPASSLGRATPVSRPAAAAPSDADTDDDDDEKAVADERLLELRRLADLEEGGEDGQGNDWIARYAGSSEEDEPPPQRVKAKARAMPAAAPAPAAAAAAAPAPKKAPAHKGLTAGAAVPVVETKRVTVLLEPKEKAPLAPAPARKAAADDGARARELKPPKRPLPKAFVPKSVEATVFVGNLPLDVGDDVVVRALSSFGKVHVFHREVSNAGALQGFGYAEFKKVESAASAVGASVTVGDRESKVLAYTAALNHRNPDGSRRKEKKRKREADGE
jgi:hypothetical protein